jgi:Arc/MetJ-type ribon-helix-helix transcriptional regulator
VESSAATFCRAVALMQLQKSTRRKIMSQQGEQLVPNSSQPNNPASTPASTVDEVFNAIRDFVTKAPETINKAVERALNVKDTTVLLRLGEKESDALDTLVSAGIFKSRMDAANFLIAEGIKSQAALFSRIQSKLDEIERLRNELRETVAPEIPK